MLIKGIKLGFEELFYKDALELIKYNFYYVNKKDFFAELNSIDFKTVESVYNKVLKDFATPKLEEIKLFSLKGDCQHKTLEDALMIGATNFLEELTLLNDLSPIDDAVFKELCLKLGNIETLKELYEKYCPEKTEESILNNDKVRLVKNPFPSDQVFYVVDHSLKFLEVIEYKIKYKSLIKEKYENLGFFFNYYILEPISEIDITKTKDLSLFLSSVDGING